MDDKITKVCSSDSDRADALNSQFLSNTEYPIDFSDPIPRDLNICSPAVQCDLHPYVIDSESGIGLSSDLGSMTLVQGDLDVIRAISERCNLGGLLVLILGLSCIIL